MCYSSMEDFGWRKKEEATRKPEARHEAPADRPEPHYTAEDFTFWAFPRRRKAQETREPAAERTHEKV